MKLPFAAAYLGLMLVIAGCSGGPSTKPIVLRLKAKEGDTYSLSFRVETHFDIPGDGKGGPPSKESTFVELDKTYVCKSADESKSTWEVKTTRVIADGTGPMKGQALSVIDAEMGRKETIERDAQNKVISESRQNPIEFIFPQGEINVGDAWRGDMNMQGNKLMMRWTVEGFEKVDGVDAVHLRGELEGDRMFRLEDPLQIWVDASNGFPIKGSGNFLINAESGIKMQMNVKMSRLK
ncbi:MAG TPA: hypothetical protein PLX06_02120 [Fimbriimonadaceae bacterium]|nr:hypothetical protein [Fimbriimonadaceae bacterium]